MPNFEYQVVTGYRKVEFPFRIVDWESPQELLKRMNEEGWELVSVVAYPELGNGMQQTKEYYFKRPIS